MTTKTDGPAALRRLAEKMPLHFESLEMIDLAAAWEAERAQAAADRAALADLAEAHNVLMEQVAAARKSTAAAEAALEQARALAAKWRGEEVVGGVLVAVTMTVRGCGNELAALLGQDAPAVATNADGHDV